MTEAQPLSSQQLPSGTSCWVVTNGMAGFEMQAVGVAEALGLSPVLKRVAPPAPHKWMAPWGPAAANDGIAAPWPDIVIASGRQSIPYARKIKKASGGKTFVAILQNPKVSPSHFDLVWAPEHDQLSGPNVVSTLTAPNRITPEKLTKAAGELNQRYTSLPPKKIAVVLGGPNKVYRFSSGDMRTLARSLKELAERENAGLMVTTSRRTTAGATAVLREELRSVPHDIYDALSDVPEDNPYPGLLGLADAIIVTCDSHNMVGEATVTGKPVYVVELEGGSAKFRRFLDALYVNNVARQFDGLLETWSYAPLNATQEIAAAIAAAYSYKPKSD
ncbi:mitochondrial fission ELM1 family protein [Parvibaculaceae bacterium PLY_AMNH_Bact1]|nr:mitochondrial fission ELM1 family protein [Parvibaculaceae bacterium PLY_AMNH_Bact1]